jgi:MFS family permease
MASSAKPCSNSVVSALCRTTSQLWLIQSAGLSESLARLIAAAVAVPLVDRYGRRIMMNLSTAIQFFCFLMFTILLYLTQKPDFAGQKEVALISVVFYFIDYIGLGLGMLGIPWLYPTEINSLQCGQRGSPQPPCQTGSTTSWWWK